MLGLVVPLVILAGFADWLFHLDSVIRAALLAALVGVRRSGWVIAACSARSSSGLPISTSPCGSRSAGPGLNDRLASTIQFLRLDAGDDRHGSPALREATVRQAVEEAEHDRLSRGDRAQAGHRAPAAAPSARSGRDAGSAAGRAGDRRGSP